MIYLISKLVNLAFFLLKASYSTEPRVTRLTAYHVTID
jgi:hypothetical protein